MDVRAESKSCIMNDGRLLMARRSVEEVTDRLDKLIVHIKSIQEPLMDGTEPADIVLVSDIFHGLK